ncbi:hypothetical protein E2C01_051023 [Portunus trituberculatus]|uniref:Uncharacterized protein n=1 Tax=Portunus trituberculatus TaxID=210409 RepID=A0A5B7GHZ1_PORTR|nr:hypothetical protein [Portunus trituberculatus]
METWRQDTMSPVRILYDTTRILLLHMLLNLSKQWLTDCEVPFIGDWPDNSPDITPTEIL